MIQSSIRRFKNLGTNLLPGALRHLDHYLVRNWPLIWRTSLVKVVWFVGLATLGIALLGFFVPMSSKNAWIKVQVETFLNSLQLISFMGIVIWGYLQVRIKVGERTIPEYLLMLLLNTLAAFLLLLPSSAFIIGVTIPIAKVLPDNIFEKEYAFHHQHNFWCCDSRINKDLITENSTRLQRSLGTFGLKTDGSISPDGTFSSLGISGVRMCQKYLPCLKITDLEEETMFNPVLRDRLESIKQSKELWQSGTGDYIKRYFEILKFNAIIGIAISIFIGLLSYPSYAWRRRFIQNTQSHWRIDIKLWQPEWLYHLDQKWLREKPMIWATRMHTFLFHSLTLGTAVVALALVSLSALTDQSLIKVLIKNFGSKSLFIFAVVLFCGAACPIAWALVRRRIFIPATSIFIWREMIGKFFLAALPIPILILLLGIGTGAFRTNTSGIDETVILGCLVYTGACLVICCSVVKNYLMAKETAVSCAIGLAAFFSPLAVHSSLGLPNKHWLITAPILPILWVLINWGIVFRMVTRCIFKGMAVTSASVIMSIPAGLFYFFIFVWFIFDKELGFSRNDSVFIAAFSFFTLSFFIYRYWLSHSMLILVKNRYDPRDT